MSKGANAPTYKDAGQRQKKSWREVGAKNVVGDVTSGGGNEHQLLSSLKDGGSSILLDSISVTKLHGNPEVRQQLQVKE